MSAVRLAATQLAELLERENSALMRFDLSTASTLLARKREALLAFEAVSPDKSGAAGSDAATRDAALRLRDAAAENKRLLERAMVAQQHVMSLLAKTARQAGSTERYGAQGAYVGRAVEGAFALSARA